MSIERKQLNSERNGTIDFLKFIFAILIVVLHAYIYSKDGSFTFFCGGYIGVEFYFLVSGYMMVNSYHKSVHETLIAKDTFVYIRKKLLYFLPYVIASQIVYVIVINWGKFSIKHLLYQFLTDELWKILLLQQAGFGQATDVLWYISAMLLAMALLYPLLLLTRDNFYYIAFIGTIFGMGYVWHTYGHLCLTFEWNGFIYSGFLRAIVELLAGSVCYYIVEKLRRIKATRFFQFVLAGAEWGDCPKTRT